MIIASTDSYQVAMTSSLHWGLVLFALVGLVISFWLIYRRFKAKKLARDQQVLPWEFKEKRHFSLLILANVISFISILLFILPLQAKVDIGTFDILLTPGFIDPISASDFNLIGIEAQQVEQQLDAAQHIWLLDEQGDLHASLQANSTGDQTLSQWLAKYYQDKVIVVNSIAELTLLWQVGSPKTGNYAKARVNRSPYFAPSSLTILGDGLSSKQWQHLLAFNQQHTRQKTRQETDDLLPQSLSDRLKGNLPENLPLNHIEFTFFASKAKTGLIDLQWQRELVLGQALTVTGRLQQPKEDSRQFQLSLVNNNHVVARIELAANQAFSLTTTSKIPGLFNYQLLLQPLIEDPNKQADISQGDVNPLKFNENNNTSEQTSKQSSTNITNTISENIAVSVVRGNRPKVLIKQSAPSFETRRLKQWLSQSKSQVHIISQISKSKWAQQKINYLDEEDNRDNLQAQAPEQLKIAAQGHLLTEKLLRENDLLVLDSRMLVTLEIAEVEALYRAISNGLGLLINADTRLLSSEKQHTGKLSQLLNLFDISATDGAFDQVIANWPEKPNLAISQSIISPSPAIMITPKSGQSLVKSTTGQTLVAQQSLGLGTVAITSLNQTYQWPLQATPALYSHYWQYLLSKIARSESNTRWLTTNSSALEQVNHDQNICLISSQVGVYSPSMRLALQPLSNTEKCGYFSADKKGWLEFQAFSTDQELVATQARYFYGAEDFLAWQQANKQQVSKKHANGSSGVESSLKVVDSYQPTDKRYLWLLMFISLSLLWIERKWQSG